MISSIMVSLAMASMAIYLMFLSEIPQNFRWLPLLLVIINFIGFSIGLSTIPLSLIGELLPTSTKNILGPLTSFFNLLFLFLVLKNYVAMASVIQYSGVYWTFSGISLFGAVFVFIFLPETKGKTIAEIENMYKNSRIQNS